MYIAQYQKTGNSVNNNQYLMYDTKYPALDAVKNNHILVYAHGAAGADEDMTDLYYVQYLNTGAGWNYRGVITDDPVGTAIKRNHIIIYAHRLSTEEYDFIKEIGSND